MVGYFRSQSFSELPFGKKSCPALNVKFSVFWFFHFIFVFLAGTAMQLRVCTLKTRLRCIAMLLTHGLLVCQQYERNEKPLKNGGRTRYDRKLYDCGNLIFRKSLSTLLQGERQDKNQLLDRRCKFYL